MDNIKRKIILASGSPRRKELLENAGISFEVLVTNVNEDMDGYVSPTEFVSVISRRKAEAAVKIYIQDGQNQAAIIAADTIVCVDGNLLGKPKDKDDAFMMLKLLNGNLHDVYTGITVSFIDHGGVEYVQDHCCTKVKFKSLSDKQIREYIDTGEPFDKAGAYAIQGQGEKLVEEIDGDYNNVVGLPVERLIEILNSSGAYI